MLGLVDYQSDDEIDDVQDRNHDSQIVSLPTQPGISPKPTVLTSATNALPDAASLFSSPDDVRSASGC